jgi:hypothetical protein
MSPRFDCNGVFDAADAIYSDAFTASDPTYDTGGFDVTDFVYDNTFNALNLIYSDSLPRF